MWTVPWHKVDAHQGYIPTLYLVDNNTRTCKDGLDETDIFLYLTQIQNLKTSRWLFFLYCDKVHVTLKVLF